MSTRSCRTAPTRRTKNEDDDVSRARSLTAPASVGPVHAVRAAKWRQNASAVRSCRVWPFAMIRRAKRWSVAAAGSTLAFSRNSESVDSRLQLFLNPHSQSVGYAAAPGASSETSGAAAPEPGPPRDRGGTFLSVAGSTGATSWPAWHIRAHQGQSERQSHVLQ